MDSNSDDESSSETTSISSFPVEIIQEILSRLPVKPLLQFKSVSKHWLSLISHPSFPKLHFSRSLSRNRTALFVSAYDASTDEQHFLSAPDHGGPLTHLITLHNVVDYQTAKAEHLNGLVLFSSYDNIAFVINPSTRKVFKLPSPDPFTHDEKFHTVYFFGFDESKFEHKILCVRMFHYRFKTGFEFWIFPLSTYSWRKIDIVGVNRSTYGSREDWSYGKKSSVCVDSVIHMPLHSQNVILAFDLTTETFSIIEMPLDAIPHESSTIYTVKGVRTLKFNYPRLMKVNGLLGVVCHDRVVETNKMHVWILQDYENRVWERKTVTFDESWIGLDGSYPLDFVNKDEIVFNPKRLSRNMMCIPMYDLKTGSFKSVKYRVDHRFLHSKSLIFDQVKSYVESILPLETNESGTS